MNDVTAAGTLAPYAAHDEESRGRRYPEPKPEFRSEFQRDRDRIIHANAFRRLVYKTQVFVNHEGDLYRTRVTHSIEVAQIARSVALALHLNETLTEAICLAHDLGHTPFGHAGQDALNECMSDYGGFEHNLQSLRSATQPSPASISPSSVARGSSSIARCAMPVSWGRSASASSSAVSRVSKHRSPTLPTR